MYIVVAIYQFYFKRRHSNMQKNLVIGIGQAGNKCIVDAINDGVVKKEDTVLVNSTSLDFPADYDGKKIVISPHNLGCGKREKSLRVT